MAREPLLSFKEVCASYDKTNVLYDISFDIFEKEIVTLIGANGAGKTTLLMSIFAQPRIKSGKILFEGFAIHSLATHEIAPLGISLCPERRRVFLKMTTEENLFLGALHSKAKKKTNENLEKMYSLFPVLKERRNQRAGTLSGGEQQMLAMARALMGAPKLFVLDEPSLGLAPQMTTHIFSLLKQIAALGTTILLAEQSAYRALALADRGYVLVNGKIHLSGSGQALLANQEVRAAYLAGGRPVRSPSS